MDPSIRPNYSVQIKPPKIKKMCSFLDPRVLVVVMDWGFRCKGCCRAAVTGFKS